MNSFGQRPLVVVASRGMETSRRKFIVDGEPWVVWVSGNGAYGTGPYGLGAVMALHFAQESEPEKPLREALLEGRELDGFFDDELIAIFRGARAVVDISQLPEGARRRARTRSLQDHGPLPSGPAHEL